MGTSCLKVKVLTSALSLPGSSPTLKALIRHTRSRGTVTLGHSQRCITTVLLYVQLEELAPESHIQGGPERMQQVRSFISRTSSIKQICFFILLSRKFIFQQNDTMTINFG